MLFQQKKSFFVATKSILKISMLQKKIKENPFFFVHIAKSVYFCTSKIDDRSLYPFFFDPSRFSGPLAQSVRAADS